MLLYLSTNQGLPSHFQWIKLPGSTILLRRAMPVQSKLLSATCTALLTKEWLLLQLEICLLNVTLMLALLNSMVVILITLTPAPSPAPVTTSTLEDVQFFGSLNSKQRSPFPHWNLSTLPSVQAWGPYCRFVTFLVRSVRNWLCHLTLSLPFVAASLKTTMAHWCLLPSNALPTDTKSFLVKWHFFWHHVRNGDVKVLKIANIDQLADQGPQPRSFRAHLKACSRLVTRGFAAFVLGGFKSVPSYPGCKPICFFMSYIITTPSLPYFTFHWMRRRVKVQQLTAVVVPLLSMKFSCRQVLSPM